MKERPILFNAEMVRAILSGRKTQTRRLMNPEHDCCPYGQPGDRLWVRETWGTSVAVHDLAPSQINNAWPTWYHADGASRFLGAKGGGPAFMEMGRWRPSIHMPRWASRLSLEITDIRVQRLQEITEAEAQAEGVEEFAPELFRLYGEPFAQSPDDDPGRGLCATARESFAALWTTINGPAAWDANPWVWVLEFRRAGQ